MSSKVGRSVSKSSGSWSDLLEIPVPRGQSQCLVEHRHPIGHVVEGDAQLLLALANFVQQPRVLHRDHRLGREILEQGDLFAAERADFLAIHTKHAKQGLVLA